MNAIKRAALRFFVAGVTAILIYAVLLAFPRPFFSHSVRADSLVLHSDLPFSEDAGRQVLAKVQAKLNQSPLFSGQQKFEIFICNAPWRRALFFNKDYRVGGVAPYPFTSNVFIREARIGDDRVVSPRGVIVSGDRTLDYFIAHEIAHQLTGHALGPIGYFRLPQWVREGYADYVGKGDSFNYEEARRALLAGAPEMDWKKSGLYWRYHLLVANCLDRRRFTVLQLLQDPPSADSVERAVVQEKP